MDEITFRFLIAMVASNKLDMKLIDVVTAYLYGLLEKDIYMKFLEGYKIIDNIKHQHLFPIKLQRSLYGIRESMQIWYNWPSDYLIKE